MTQSTTVAPPVWTWEVPLYFFVGGAAGLAAVIAFAAGATGADPAIARAAWGVAAAGAAVSPLLLISDLGRPGRFLYMLRVFKRQSAMSVGAWTLVAFSGAVATVLATDWLAARMPSFVLLPAAGAGAGFVAALTGLTLATYTGVLLGATAIPVWAAHRRRLPLHFGASSLGAAVSLVELAAGFLPVLNVVGLGAAAIETVLGIAQETARRRADATEDRHLGTLVRVGYALSGVLPLLLRGLAAGSPPLRAVAACSAIAGSLASRYGWLAAGRRSASKDGVCETVGERSGA